MASTLQAPVQVSRQPKWMGTCHRMSHFAHSDKTVTLLYIYKYQPSFGGSEEGPRHILSVHMSGSIWKICLLHLLVGVSQTLAS